MKELKFSFAGDADYARFIDSACDEFHYKERGTKNESKEDFVHRIIKEWFTSMVREREKGSWTSDLAEHLKTKEDDWVSANPAPKDISIS